MTLVDFAVHWTGDRSAIFPRVETLTYVIGFFYFYAKLMRGVANDTAERAFQICSVKGKLLRLCKICQERGIDCEKTVPINPTFVRVLSS